MVWHTGLGVLELQSDSDLNDSDGDFLLEYLFNLYPTIYRHVKAKIAVKIRVCRSMRYKLVPFRL